MHIVDVTILMRYDIDNAYIIPCCQENLKPRRRKVAKQSVKQKSKPGFRQFLIREVEDIEEHHQGGVYSVNRMRSEGVKSTTRVEGLSHCSHNKLRYDDSKAV